MLGLLFYQYLHVGGSSQGLLKPTAPLQALGLSWAPSFTPCHTGCSDPREPLLFSAWELPAEKSLTLGH